MARKRLEAGSLMDFRTLPDGPLTLCDVTVPACLLGQKGDLVRTDLSIADGRIAAAGGTPVAMNGAMAFPAFVDMHTHLDKGHIWGRAANPDGTFLGALETVAADRAVNWSARDVRARMEFALRCAHAHGTRAIRTHLDSLPPQDDISWPVFATLRADWADRIDLQAVCLVSCENVSPDGPFAHTADLVAQTGGVLGMVTYDVPGFDRALADFLAMAADRACPWTCMSMKTAIPGRGRCADCRSRAGNGVRRTGHGGALLFAGDAGRGRGAAHARPDGEGGHQRRQPADVQPVSAGPCRRPHAALARRHAGPRDEGAGSACRSRPTTPATRSMPMATRHDGGAARGDPDRPSRPCRCGLGAVGPGQSRAGLRLRCAQPAPGASADLVICRARSWTELFARPQTDRIVLRAGRAIDRTLPDYAELDPDGDPMK
jgi:cytosine deaminase